MDRELIQNDLIRVSKSCLGEEEKSAVEAVLDIEFLGMGPKVKEFEHMLADFFDSEVVCVSSGTAALQIALQSLGIGNGDEVIVPSLTYLASFQAISATGAKPIPCEVLPDTLTMDPNDVESKINSKTKAIMPVHYSGGVGMIEAIYSLADKFKLRVVEDAAHAFGTIHNGNNVGSFGDIACFSFDGIKNITSGEGGCIVSRDQNIISKSRDLRLLGVKGDSDNRYNRERTWCPEVDMQGWRYHMSDIMAAIGLAQLEKFEFFAKKRQFLAMKYDSYLMEDPRIKIIEHDYKNIVPHIYTIRIKDLEDKQIIKQKLETKMIQTAEHYFPNHLLDFYRVEGICLEHTEKIYKEILSLPLHPDLSDKDIDYVCKILIEVLNDIYPIR